MHQLRPDALLGAIDFRHELGCLRNKRRPCLGECSLGDVGVVVRLGDDDGGCPYTHPFGDDRHICTCAVRREVLRQGGA